MPPTPDKQTRAAKKSKTQPHWLRLLGVGEAGVGFLANREDDDLLLKGLAQRKSVMRLIATRALNRRNRVGLERLIRKGLRIAFRRGEDIRLIIGHEVRRVSRRDVGEVFHRSWDAVRWKRGQRMARSIDPECISQALLPRRSRIPNSSPRDVSLVVVLENADG